jgi:hypothetical protein
VHFFPAKIHAPSLHAGTAPRNISGALQRGKLQARPVQPSSHLHLQLGPKVFSPEAFPFPLQSISSVQVHSPNVIGPRLYLISLVKMFTCLSQRDTHV